MQYRSTRRSALALVALGALWCSVAAGAVPTTERRVEGAARSIRQAGCANRAGVRMPLERDASLDRVAAAWARGGTLAAALDRVGVRSKRSGSLRIATAGRSAAQLESSLRAGLCTPLTTADYAAIGVHDDGERSSVVIAQLFIPPPAAAADEVAARSLSLVNRARASARRCGSRAFAIAPPLRASAVLTAAARAQARDLASHSVLSHRGSDGSDPGKRATLAGYRWRVVGENVASGPQTADEVIAGWLDSPDHCENIMDPRYTEMGIAYAVNTRSSGVIYWSQTFGLPR